MLNMPINNLIGGYATMPATDTTRNGGNIQRNALVIDGTPIRVVTLSLAAAAGLVALKWAGFRFNVGVSN